MTDISKEKLEEILGELDPDYRDTLGRKRLYERGFREYPHLPELVMKWFQEIGNEVSPLDNELWFSKRRPSGKSREGLPPWVYHEDTLETPPLDEVHRVRIGDQRLLIWVGDERTSEGYRKVVVRDGFFRVDEAILSVLVIMEADRTKLKKPWEYVGDEPELDLARALLQYYREDFDALSPDDQKDLAIDTFSRVCNVLEALRLLMAYLEYGKPGEGVPRHPLEKVREHVRAAELKHIEKLKNYKIAEELNLPKPEDYNENSSWDRERYARRVKGKEGYAGQGERILKEAFGDEGFKEYVKKRKAEKKRWKLLNDKERVIERLADLSGISAKHLRSLYEEKLKEALPFLFPPE